MSKKALLVVSFGTSHKDTRDKTIGAIEIALKKAFPDREIKRAFTSGMIMKILKDRDGIYVDSTEEALKKLKEEGFIDVIVQPTHIINGDEYDKMMAQIEPYKRQFEQIIVGNPLLTSSEDYEKVCKALIEKVTEISGDGLCGIHRNDTMNGTVLVLMGHGTGHFADAAYAALDYRFKSLGHKNVFVGTVEGYPDIEEVLKQVKSFEAKRVILLPFMIVAGDHAINDMAGDEEDSWKTIFTEAGYETKCILKGIGEFTKIQNLFVEHANIAK